MLDLILLEISLLIICIYIIFKLRHGLHIFQLESYKHKRYKMWMKKNIKDLFNIREFMLIIPIIIMFFNIKIALIVQIVELFLLWVSRDIYKEKKPLVITTRIKRYYIITLIILLFLAVYANISFIKAEKVIIKIIPMIIFDIFVFCTMSFVFLVDIIDKPVQLLTNRKFYNMAKNKLKNMPDLIVIGITGSYGKTSSKYILSTILNQKYNVLITPGNFNTLLGVERTINDKLKPTDQVFVCEMGAKNIGDIKEICDLVHPKMAMLTAIGPQHLDTFKTLENVRKTKMELINSLPEDGIAVVNYEDENVRNTTVDKKNIKYGFDSDYDIYAYNISMTEEGSVFDIHTEKEEIKNVKTKLLGKHSIINIIGAIGIAQELGLTAEEIKLGISYLKPVEHRLELRRAPNGLTIIDDAYNANIKGSKNAFETLKMFKNKTKIIVTPGMVELGEKDYEYNKELGKNAADNADFVILVGEKQAEPIKEGLLSRDFPEEKIYVAANIEEAMKKWNEFPAKDTVILLENDLPDNYL